MATVAALALAFEVSAWFALEPAHDDFQGNILDCSRWVDAPTGKHGFVTVRDGRLRFQDGAAARFWGAEMELRRNGKEQVDYTVRRMRRQGINITRLNGMESLNDRNGKTSFDYDRENWDRLDYLVAKLGENGIYLILDVDYPKNYRFKPEDHVAGLADGGPAQYAEFFDETVAGILRHRLVDVVTHRNPYTNKRYCDDPTLALMEVLNEDSLFWGDIPDRYYAQLAERLGKHTAWLPNRELLARQLQAKPELQASAREQLRGMEDFEEKYWISSRDAMRKAGLKVPVSATNWQGHGSPTTRIHMLGQSKMDYIDRHGYWDHPQGEGILIIRWRIATAQFHNLPMIKDVKADQTQLVWLGVENLVTEKAWERVLGMPLTVSEWNTCLPNEYSLEGPGLMAAYGLLQGWDASLEFGYFSADWRDALGPSSFDVLGNPPQILQFPAVTAMWHRQDVREGDLVAESLYDAASVYAPTEDRKPLPVAAALVGKVGYRFVEKARDAVVKDISRYWNPQTLTARSTTGELSWNASDGVVTIDTPLTQAVIGFLSVGVRTLGAVRVSSQTRFGAVYVTAMDEQAPIRTARRLLVTAVGPARNTGMEYESTRQAGRIGTLWRLRKPGDAPALMEAVSGEVEIRSSRAGRMKCWSLDLVGKRRAEVPLRVHGDAVVLILAPDHRTAYYEISVR